MLIVCHDCLEAVLSAIEFISVIEASRVVGLSFYLCDSGIECAILTTFYHMHLNAATEEDMVKCFITKWL